ncbi:RPII140-upstream gene protein [Plodia interpunctella]|uniref:RPII140-upstream gene protein n=1 Tax=Plodia interpunctella TaxID=58824 RepID=UPI00236870F4|nr:RPII140-upstream gene protein [Plodia interpunctella]XP_053602523.1 RPII140-upstream gene protein [Plodia interpunctella]
MLRSVVRLTPTFIIPIFKNRNENDYVSNSTQPVVSKTGWERVKKMYSRDEFEVISVELNSVVQASLAGAFIGACMGGFVSSRQAYLYFIENNQATIFKSTMEAKKKLQDKVTIGFAHGAVRWGWRLSLFTGMFSLIATTISVYRDDTSLTQFITAGALTGGIYKLHLGTAATFVGAGLGAALSAVFGGAILGVLYLSGFSMQDIRQSLYRIKLAREDQYNQVLENAATIKNDELTKHHDKLVQEKGQITVENIE